MSEIKPITPKEIPQPIGPQALPEELEKRFQQVRQALIDKYKSKMNPASVDTHLAKLMMNERITESYQLSDHPQAPVITFRDLKADMFDLITRLSMLNLNELRSAAPGEMITPRVDENYRRDMLMAASIVQLREEEYEDLGSQLPKAHENNTVRDLVAKLESRVQLIKNSLHPLLYQEAQAAFAVWINYVANLIKPDVVENF